MDKRKGALIIIVLLFTILALSEGIRLLVVFFGSIIP